MKTHSKGVLLWLIVLMWCGMQVCLAQVVTSVSFEVVDNNSIEVTYNLNASEIGQDYDVQLYASMDGGANYSKARSVSGDVGRISISGKKRILWKVLSDVESFEGDRCVVKVIAEEVHPAGERIGDFLFGSKLTRTIFNGLHFHGGWQTTRFSGNVYRDAVSKGTIATNGGFEAGLKYLNLPFALECDYFLQTYRLKSGDAVNHTGINVSGSVALIPIAHFLVPSIGIGYQGSALYVGESPGDKATSEAATNALFASAGGHIQLSSSFGAGVEYKMSLSAGDRQWNQLIVYLSFIYRQ